METQPDTPENPTEEELDVEGPNEGAPGDAPEEGAGEEAPEEATETGE
jgi:hypothetical protein